MDSRMPENTTNSSFESLVSRAVQTQAEIAPPGRVLARLRAEARSRPQQRPLPWWWQAAWGTVLTVAVSLILWGVWLPGAALQWQASGNAWQTFRIYRAPVGTGDFSLVAEIPAEHSGRPYLFRDTFVWPGVSYVYRVEGITRQGRIALSRTVVHPGRSSLVQAGSILLFGLGLGLLGVAFLPQGIPKRREMSPQTAR